MRQDPQKLIRAEMAKAMPPTLAEMDAERRRLLGGKLPSVRINLITGLEEALCREEILDFKERFPGVDPYIHTPMAPDVRKAIVECVRAGNYVHVACMKAGVTKATVDRWLQMADRLPGTVYSAFRDDLNEAIADAEIAMVETIRKAAGKEQYWTAAAWWLERTKPDQYAQKAVVKHQVEREVQELLRHLERNLPPDVFKMVIEAIVTDNPRVEAEEIEALDVPAHPALPESNG